MFYNIASTHTRVHLQHTHIHLQTSHHSRIVSIHSLSLSLTHCAISFILSVSHTLVHTQFYTFLESLYHVSVIVPLLDSLVTSVTGLGYFEWFG